jgi:hypothetical protein
MMSRIIGIGAFVFVMAQGHGFGSALVGGIGCWFICRYIFPGMLRPAKVQRYDGLGNPDPNGPYTTPH